MTRPAEHIALKKENHPNVLSCILNGQHGQNPSPSNSNNLIMQRTGVMGNGFPETVGFGKSVSFKECCKHVMNICAKIYPI